MIITKSEFARLQKDKEIQMVHGTNFSVAQVIHPDNPKKLIASAWYYKGKDLPTYYSYEAAPIELNID